MVDINVDVKGVAVFSCRTEDEDGGSPEQVGVYEGDELEDDDDGREVHDIVERMLEHDALDKGYGNRKNARVHQWNGGANGDENTEDPAEDIFDEVRSGDNLADNAETLATRYVRQDQSAQDILLTVRYEHGSRDFAAILKTPYLEGAREIDVNSAKITENDYVIEDDTDKCILYPYVDFQGDIDTDRSRIFQENGASNYAKYWYRFVGLEKKKLPDEIVEQELRSRAKESTSGAAFDSFQDFSEESEDLFEDETHLQGEVQLSLGDQRQFRVSLRELKEQEDVILARDGDEIYVILSGNVPKITSGSGNQKKSVFDSLDGIQDLEDVLEDLA